MVLAAVAMIGTLVRARGARHAPDAGRPAEPTARGPDLRACNADSSAFTLR
jgi:hypothetical protein